MQDGEKRLDKKILFTGGGSGGHISAATAIVQEFEKEYVNLYEKILYVGGKLGMSDDLKSGSLEMKIVGEESEIPFKAIRAGKLQRYWSWQSIRLLGGVFGGLIDAFKIIREFKPDLLISTGGYVTVPLVLVAWLYKVPIYLHEQTAAIGLTNKIASKFAKKVFTSFPGTEEYLPAEKIIHVGNTVRNTVFETDGKGEVVDHVWSLQNYRVQKPIILVTGGGQGSHLLNTTFMDLMPKLLEKYQLVIQCGNNTKLNDYDKLQSAKAKLPANIQRNLYITKYIPGDQIGYVFANIDLHVGRSGANFVYESALLEIPSIFVPIPWVTHNEQYKNAKALADIGLATVLEQKDLTPESMHKTIDEMMRKIENKELNYTKKDIQKSFPKDATVKILQVLKARELQ